MRDVWKLPLMVFSEAFTLAIERLIADSAAVVPSEALPAVCASFRRGTSLLATRV